MGPRCQKVVALYPCRPAFFASSAPTRPITALGFSASAGVGLVALVGLVDRDGSSGCNCAHRELALIYVKSIYRPC